VSDPPVLSGLDDIVEHVESRLVVVCHVWPGITPEGVWALPLRLWLRFATAADKWAADRQRAEQEGG